MDNNLQDDSLPECSDETLEIILHYIIDELIKEIRKLKDERT